MSKNESKKRRGGRPAGKYKGQSKIVHGLECVNPKMCKCK